jgi:hypothetical protein
MVPDFEEGNALGMIHNLPQVQRAILNIAMQQGRVASRTVNGLAMTAQKEIRTMSLWRYCSSVLYARGES